MCVEHPVGVALGSFFLLRFGYSRFLITCACVRSLFRGVSLTWLYVEVFQGSTAPFQQALGIGN